jgi:site-specific DNA-methyltransferase (adenine-specific)
MSEVTLHLGDCLEVMKDIPAGSVDAVVTDPPYFQPAAHYCPTRDEGAPKKSIGDMSILESFFKLFISEGARITNGSGWLYVFCDGQSYPIAFTGMYPHVKRVRPLIWDKMTSFNGYTWRHQHELIAYGEMKDAPQVPTGDGDILQCRAVKVKERCHPAEKPIELIKKILGKTPENTTILDPFMGSGTTGVACVQTGRNFIGIEIDPHYYEIAEKRITEAQLQIRMPI